METIVEERCGCGKKLRWIPKYERFYCHNCGTYPPECPKCSSDLFYVTEHNRYYCNSCQDYADVAPSDQPQQLPEQPQEIQTQELEQPGIARARGAMLKRLQVAALAVLTIIIIAGVGFYYVTQTPTQTSTRGFQQQHKVKVLPVFFVAGDAKEPNDKEIQLLQKHLLIAQDRYRVMMKNRDTFDISSNPAVIYKSPSKLMFFKDPHRGAEKYTTELLQYLNVDRYDCPYIFLIIVINSHDGFPAGGGRPINGGVNKGGGIVIMSSYLLNEPGGKFQSTLQHELGHSFGLLHVDAYGYDMQTSDSVMSYNPNDEWKGFEPPKMEGILIPEDLYALSKNKLVFPNFYFDPERDMPAGYRLNKAIDTKPLPPMDLSTEHFGFELFWDGKRVGHEPTWSSRQAIETLLWNIHQQADKKVEGQYYGTKIVISGIGYELYYNGERVGHEPTWNYEQAVSNLHWNVKQVAINDPGKEVVGLYNGSILT